MKLSLGSIWNGWNLQKTWPLHFMVWFGFIFLLLFAYYPMYGIIMAFQNFRILKGFSGSDWIGLENFNYLFNLPTMKRVIINTAIISTLKIITGLIVPIVFALLLNEIRHALIKKTIQTLVYLPYFISWVILGGILIDILSVNGGLINQVLGLFGIEPIFFLGSNDWFRSTIIVSNLWRETGFSAIIFLAALSGINPSLYEAAEIDGAGKLKQLWHVTLPSIAPIIIVVGALSLGALMSAGFDQIFNLYNPSVYATGDIIDTFIYRLGLVGGNYSAAAAMGLFNSIINFILIVIAYYLSYRLANYRIF